MYYSNQEFDFVQRTIEIIKQYEKFQIDKKEKFEVTLFINCLVGLLILPQQYWFDNLPTDIVSQREWGISPEHISTIKKGETKNVKDIARHLRNSVAHYNFIAFKNSSSKICSIQFRDKKVINKTKKEIKTFEAKIPIECLKKFVNKLSDNFIISMTKHK